KIFRRVSEGRHPEPEMGRYLTQSGFANVPPLLGEIVRLSTDGAEASLGLAQGFVRNQGDAWAWLLDHLLRALDDLAAPDPSAQTEADHLSDYETLAASIGQRLGEMHMVLARATEDPAFAPAAATAEDTAHWSKRTEAQLNAALAVIAGHPWSRAGDARRAAALEACGPDLLAAVRDLALAGRGALMTRIHGDFHLGQVLVVRGDIYIIDFEGQPTRPITERRAKSSPLRDVAGLLRSFDYAAATIIDRRNVGSARISDDRRDEFIARFRACAPAAFLRAYGAAVAAADNLMNERLLDLFLIEQAAYEITYEAASRPTWLAVPLAGLSVLANRVLQGREERS
ncbi:MAG: putative maltokinase, partial [Xanthobacteraceae bacterium]